MIDIKVKVVKTKDYTCIISKEKLIQILNNSDIFGNQIPDDTEITITVPSGGDYSGDSLPLDEAGGLTLWWQKVEK